MYKNSKFTIILPAVVACSLVAGVLLGGLVFRTSRPVVRRPALTAPGSDKINRLLSLIGTQYVDSVSIDSLTERVIPLSWIPIPRTCRLKICRGRRRASKGNSTGSGSFSIWRPIR